MSIDYLLLSLRCDACAQEFPVYTELSNHHLDAHERPLHGLPVAVWLARDVTPPPHASKAFCVCGCVFAEHSTHPSEPAQPCAACDCLAWQRWQGAEDAAPAPHPRPVTVFGALRWQCADAGVPCSVEEGLHLLEALGLQPEAPAERFTHAIAEAVARWRDRQGGKP